MNPKVSRRELLKGLGAGVAGGLLMAACGQPPAPTAAPATSGGAASSGAAPAAAPKATEGKVKLRFLITNIWQEMDQYVQEYQKANPNVEIEQIPAREKQPEKATALIMANDVPEIIGLEQNKGYPVWVKHNKFNPTPAEFVKELDLFDVARKGASDPKGNMLFVPYDTDVKPLVWFSKKALDEVGIDPAKFPADHDGQLAAYQKLVKKDAAGNITRYAVWEYPDLWYYDMAWILGWVEPKGDANWLPSYIGGSSPEDKYRFTSPEYIKGLTTFQKLFKGPTLCATNKEDRVKGIKADFYAGLYYDSAAPFGLKKDAPEITPVYVELPTQPGHLGRVECVVHGWGVHKDTPLKDQAYAFIKYLVGENIQTEQYKLWGVMPSRKSSFSAIGKLDKNEVVVPITMFEKRLNESMAFPWADPMFARIDAEVLNPMAAKVGVAGEDPAKVAEWAEKEANLILSGAK